MLSAICFNLDQSKIKKHQLFTLFQMESTGTVRSYSIHLFWHIVLCSRMLFLNGRKEYFSTCAPFRSDVLNGKFSEHCFYQCQNKSKLKPIIPFLNLYHMIVIFNNLPEKYAFESIVGKIENAGK